MPKPGTGPSRPKYSAERAACVAVVAGLALLIGAAAAQEPALRPFAVVPFAVVPFAVVPFAVVDDAIPDSLTGRSGDPVRGRAIVVDRQRGLCLLCHPGPFPEERFQGDLAPDLGGVGARLTEGQLRLRLADGRVLVPGTIMPSYYRVDGLNRVAAARRGQPVLTAGEIEDVVAFLATLRN